MYFFLAFVGQAHFRNNKPLNIYVNKFSAWPNSLKGHLCEFENRHSSYWHMFGRNMYYIGDFAPIASCPSFFSRIFLALLAFLSFFDKETDKNDDDDDDDREWKDLPRAAVQCLYFFFSRQYL